MSPRPTPEKTDEERPRRPARKAGPSPIGLVLVLVVLAGALVLALSMNKKKAAEAKTQDAPVADPFEGLPEEPPPVPASQRRKAK